MIRLPKKCLFTTACFICLIPYAVLSQKSNPKNTQKILQKAIDKCLPACVKMWDYDTVTHQQTSAPFSGVVIDSAGDILTAAHVTVPGKTCMVSFPDGKICLALGMGKIELAQDASVPDVGMMKILSKGTWPYAEMGHSSVLLLNEPCLSISYPESLFSNYPVVRFGYISSVSNAKGFVQSTCIMEPGDSGGPLFDCEGRVIALHSAIDIPEAINYEIPVDLYRKYWAALHSPIVYSSFPDTSAYVSDIAGSQHKALDASVQARLHSIFARLATQAQGSSLEITSQFHGKSEKAVGTLFSFTSNSIGTDHPATGLAATGSLVVSKSSIVGNDSVILLQGHRRTGATVVYRDKKNDLVLLRPNAPIKGGISDAGDSAKPGVFSSSDIRSGELLFSPLPDTVAVQSVAGGGPFRSPKFFSIGFLGASIAPQNIPLVLVQIQPHSPADDEGFKAGDEVLSINGALLNKAEDYGGILMQCWPGDTVTIQLKRSDNVFSREVVLGMMPLPAAALRHPAEQFIGGKSIIRDGFPLVFSHDAILSPERCGGPVFNGQGRFCGINIARHSRASTLVIPASIVYQVMSAALNVQATQPKS